MKGTDFTFGQSVGIIFALGLVTVTVAAAVAFGWGCGGAVFEVLFR